MSDLPQPAPGFEFTDDGYTDGETVITYTVRVPIRRNVVNNRIVDEMRLLAHQHAADRLRVDLSVSAAYTSVLSNTAPF